MMLDNYKCRGKGRYNGAFGVVRAYRWLCKHKWPTTEGKPIDRHTFFTVIAEVDKILADKLTSGNEIKFPCGMGQVCVCRKQALPILNKKGKYTIRNGQPDWKSTFELWEKDPEAKKQKVLVRFINKYVYYFQYRQLTKVFKNWMFYNFVAHKKVRIRLKDKIQNGEVQTVW